MAKQDHENKWELGQCTLEVRNGGNGSCQSWFQDLDCKVRSKVCLSRHYKIICMALNNLEKEVKQGSYIKKGGCIC